MGPWWSLGWFLLRKAGRQHSREEEVLDLADLNAARPSERQLGSSGERSPSEAHIIVFPVGRDTKRSGGASVS